MGMLVDGQWIDEQIIVSDKDGRFKRKPSSFRNHITADGRSGFQAEAGRYHLYVSYACPWAHRTLIFRKLKRLDNSIAISVVDPSMGDKGWAFHLNGERSTGAIPDPLFNATYMHEIYTAADATYTGRVTVPVLWDKMQGTIVNNESSEIIRMFNTEFNDVGNSDDTLDFYPASLRSEIDKLNDIIYDTVNNGVYKSGFARSQAAYDEAVTALFDTLDMVEARLSQHRYLVGNTLTEADWRLFPTLVRFDPVYHGHFKCNVRRVIDYPNMYNYLKDLYQVPSVAETVDFEHIKNHYYGSHESINPSRIVAKGPVMELDLPHDRGRFENE